MAVTTDQLTVDIKVTAEGATESLKKLKAGVEKLSETFSGMGDSADKAAAETKKSLLGSAEDIIRKNIELMKVMELRGQTEMQIIASKSKAAQEEIRYLESFMSMNGQLTDSMKSQLGVAKETIAAAEKIATEELKAAAASKAAAEAAKNLAVAEAAKNAAAMDQAGILDELKSRTIAIVQATEKRGKSAADLAAVEHTHALTALDNTEKRLASEGRLTQSILDQLQSQRNAVNADFESKVKLAAAKEGAKNLDSAAKATEGLGMKLVVLNQVLEIGKTAFRLVEGFVSKSIHAFMEADAQAERLNNTLRVMGVKDVVGAAAGWKAFATEIQKTTVVEDDAVLGMVGLAKAAGLSDDATEKLIKTSADLAAITGKDVNEAFNLLKGSLKGQGRGLAEVVPDIKNFTEEQLKAGAAVDFLNERFSGAAANQAATFGGQMKQMANLVGDAFEELGNVFVTAFDLAGPGTAVKDFLISVIDGLKRFASGIEAANKSAADFTPLLIAVASAAALVFGPAALSAVIAWVTAVSAANAPLILMAAEFAAIVVGVLAVAAAVDILVRNFGNLGNVWMVLKKSMETGVRFIADLYLGLAKIVLDNVGGAFTKVAGILGFNSAVAGINSLSAATDTLIARNSAAAGAAFDDLSAAAKKVDFGFAGDLINKGTGFLKGFNATLDETGKKAKDPGKSFKEFNQLTEEAKKQLVELAKMVGDLASKNAQIGATQADVIRIQGAENFKALEAKEKELIKSKALTDEAKRLLAVGRQMAGESIVLQLAELSKASLNEQIAQTKELELTKASMTANSLERIAIEEGKRLDAIDKTIQEYERESGIHDEAIEQLEKQKTIIEEIADEQRKKAPSAEFEAAKKAGTDVADSISSSITGGLSGAGGVITGMMSGAGAVMGAVSGVLDFVQQLIDIIPQLLSKIANIFNTLTELPLKIASGIKDVMKSIVKFITDFIPNLLKSIPEILDTLVTGVFQSIPDAIIKLMDSLPEIIGGVIDRLPDILEKLINGLVTAAPRVSIALMEFLISDAPKIAIAIMKTMYITLPKIIIKSLIEAFKQLFSMFGNFFKGVKLPKAEIDTKSLKNFGKKLTGEASKLFAVMDLTEGLKKVAGGGGPLDKAANSIEDILKKAGKWLKEIWDKFISGLVTAWRLIYDKILKPFVDMLKAVWEFVMELAKAVWNGIINLLRGIWDGVKLMWDAVILALKTVWNVVKTMFTAFISELSIVWEFIKNIWDGIIKAFSGALDIFKGIFDTMKAVFTDAFSGIKDFFSLVLKGKIDEAFKSVIETFTKMGQTIWDGLSSAFMKYTDVLTGLGTSIWDGLKKAAGGVGTLFSDMGTSIWNSLKDGLGGLGKIMTDALNAINPSNLLSKMFTFSGGGKGDVENALSKIAGGNFDVPFTSFARGGFVSGMVPGLAKVAGDAKINDTVAAMLSPGEVVIPRSLMNDPLINGLVSGIMDGSLSHPEKLWSMFKDKALSSLMAMVQGSSFYKGGQVPGYAFGGEVPSSLQSGQFAMNRGAAGELGLPFMKSINSGQSPGGTTVNIEMKIDTTESIDENFVRNRLMPRIRDEIRRASLDGQFVISGKGIR